MNPATVGINRSLLFIRALTAHIDHLWELLGDQWREFCAQLLTILDELEQVGEDQIPLYTTRLIEAGLKTPAADLVRALLKQVNDAVNHPDSAARSLRLTDPTSGQSREVIVGKETETIRHGLDIATVTYADVLVASRKLTLALSVTTGGGAYISGDVAIGGGTFVGRDQIVIAKQVDIDTGIVKSSEPTPERRISTWISERPEGLQKPLRVGDAYTLNFKVGQPVRGTLIEGPETVVPSSDVPDQGLETEWRITSQTVVLASLTPDTTVNTTVIDQNPVWTAHFSLHIPKEGESRTPQLKIIPLKARDARIDIVIYARREIYRQFTVELAVEESTADLEPQTTGVATIRGDVILSPAGHLNLHTTHEWTTPPGELSIAVIGTSAYVRGDAGPQYIDQITQWYGVQAAVAGRIDNVRRTAERFRARWEAYLNDINPDDLTGRLQRWSPDYDWAIPMDHADDAHRQQWETVSTSPELRALASDGHRLFEAFFPANSELRAWLDALQPGHRINISWQQTGGPGWIPHIPWGLMYRREPPRAGEPVDPLGFLALRFRVGYTPYQTQGGKNLGGLQNSYQAYLLYWGTDPRDPAGAESDWQRQQWATWQNRVIVPATLPSNRAKEELLSLLAEPTPNPMNILYLFCHCAVGAGNEPVLRFGASAQVTDDTLDRIDLDGQQITDRPLMFANACTTSATDPYIANELETLFFERGCRAYLGTESKVPIQLASRFARIFFHFFYRQADPAPMAAGEAVVQTRRFLWNHYRNIGGLFYTYVNQYELFMAQEAELIALRT